MRDTGNRIRRVRRPNEAEAFALTADAIRKEFEPDARVHVSTRNRSITIIVPPTIKMGAETDWRIKFRRDPR